MSTGTNYIPDLLPPSIVEKLEAGAFRSLCSHLRERSDEVQNLDLMTISGFCRNCLAKVCVDTFSFVLSFFGGSWSHCFEGGGGDERLSD